jgi:hypothetical protein
MVLPSDPTVHMAELAVAEWAVPSRRAAAMFKAKVFAHRIQRHIADIASGPRRWGKSADLHYSSVVAESRTRLWLDGPPEEHAYQLGKVQNLRRATAALDRVIVPAGQIFSFWKQIGRASRRRGFVTGRMLQQGCLVPATGGGLCQLSNALYDAALQAGCEIVERHPHSRIVPGSAAAAGRDATIAWNYVDLRFRPRSTLQIGARLTRDELIIRFHGAPGSAVTPLEPAAAAARHSPAAARSCATCGETSCFRHEHHPHPTSTGLTAYLVDENWPEFQDYIAGQCVPEDELGLPLDGARWRLSRYRWDVPGLSCSGSAPLQALMRTIAIRRAPAQGAARRNAELDGTERIAARLARLLSPEITRVCVAQSLLPFLWRAGHLGGREVDVLMTRPPMAELQARLDRAFAAHPERTTLGDFRAAPELVQAEAEALAYAARIVTPHHDIARLFPDKIVTLPWKLSTRRTIGQRASASRCIAFPGPTVARKGAYALRAAARALDLEIITLGNELEGADFWNGIAMRRAEPGADWLAHVAAVVQPAIVEERPRHLLSALAAGVPVITTRACGLAPQEGITLVPADDETALIEALDRDVI